MKSNRDVKNEVMSSYKFGELSLKSKAFVQGVVHFSRVLKLDETMFDAYYMRARCNRLLCKFDAAKSDLQIFVEKSSHKEFVDDARVILKEIEDGLQDNSIVEEAKLKSFIKSHESVLTKICEEDDAEVTSLMFNPKTKGKNDAVVSVQHEENHTSTMGKKK